MNTLILLLGSASPDDELLAQADGQKDVVVVARAVHEPVSPWIDDAGEATARARVTSAVARLRGRGTPARGFVCSGDTAAVRRDVQGLFPGAPVLDAA